MSAKIIDGAAHASAMRSEFKSQVEALKARGVQPGLAVVLVGDDPASQVYVRNKEKACIVAGMYSEVHRMPGDTSESTLLAFIEGLNANPKIHGILVQLPLPKQIDEEKVIELISPAKDVDCFHPYNVGRVSIGEGVFYPCTPYGVIKLLEREGVSVSGKHAVVIGRSNIVGKPMALLLINQGATVTVCNSRTSDLAGITRQADILVVAVGKPALVTANMVKPGAAVIDVGMNRLPDGKLVGDVDFASVAEKAGYITPVPGGVGPMTITMLLANTLASAQRAAQ
ncbi:MAG TPA: bifunctional methylenetetrahydrofolate dehydrogenase/methenyltetrahydrofolate cyclohydrolase FolD [Burkholderiales bacterium]|nr:bifunctional methylenetetrahydrofolate dehydrogenase/methenyltetrahydrofolate cyclohydrolase FolD [Burkholderiales bacterium]